LRPIVSSDLTAFAVEDEAVGPVPSLDDVEAFLDFASQRYGVYVPTKKDRFDRLAQLCKSQVSGMLRLLRVKRFK
jgi:hypothetical protein